MTWNLATTAAWLVFCALNLDCKSTYNNSCRRFFQAQTVPMREYMSHFVSIINDLVTLHNWHTFQSLTSSLKRQVSNSEWRQMHFAQSHFLRDFGAWILALALQSQSAHLSLSVYASLGYAKKNVEWMRHLSLAFDLHEWQLTSEMLMQLMSHVGLITLLLCSDLGN
jgi:hypothetical protein